MLKLTKIPIRIIHHTFSKLFSFIGFVWSIKTILFLISFICGIGFALVSLPITYRDIPFIPIYGGFIAFAFVLFVIIFSIAIDRLAETIGVSMQAMLGLKNSIDGLRFKLNEEFALIKELNRTIKHGNDLESKRQEESARDKTAG